VKLKKLSSKLDTREEKSDSVHQISTLIERKMGLFFDFVLILQLSFLQQHEHISLAFSGCVFSPVCRSGLDSQTHRHIAGKT
jgi:hypothetical protein